MSDDDIDRRLEQGLKIIQKNQKKKNETGIKIKLDTEGFKEVVRQNTKLMEDLEEQKAENESLTTKMVLIAEQSLAKKKRELREAGFKGDLDSIEDVREAWNATHKTGAGTIPLARASGSNSSGEYDSVKSMIDDLQRRKARGEGYAKVVLRELFGKLGSGIIEGRKAPEGYKPKPQFNELGEELGYAEMANREWRKRHMAELLEKKEKREEK